MGVGVGMVKRLNGEKWDIGYPSAFVWPIFCCVHFLLVSIKACNLESTFSSYMPRIFLVQDENECSRTTELCLMTLNKRIALNNGTGDSSGFMGSPYIQHLNIERKEKGEISFSYSSFFVYNIQSTFLKGGQTGVYCGNPKSNVDSTKSVVFFASLVLFDTLFPCMIFNLL